MNQSPIKMNLLLPLFLLSLLHCYNAKLSTTIGINYGQLGNNLPSPSRSIHLIQSLKAGFVKLYDANPKILKALSKTKIQVSIMVPNELIINISSSQSLADKWIQTNLIPFYPKTNIRYVLVGNEILSLWQDPKIWRSLVPAMIKIQMSLKSHKLLNIKVSTPSAVDVLDSTLCVPPSNGTFRADISVSVVKPLLYFLNKTKSPFLIDLYPYFLWSANPKRFSLDYALFRGGNITYTDPVSKLSYTNLLDQMIDSVIFAMRKLGFPDIQILIAETGWPTAGDLDQIGANIYNAAIYNRNLVRKLSAQPAVGTPARPGSVIPAWIFALYNENQKGGPTTERHWGLFYPNETQVYKLTLAGRQPGLAKSLPPPTNNLPYKGKIWCVVAKGMEKNSSEIEAALKYTCGAMKGICDAIQPGKVCYRKGDLVELASYAFNAYWVKTRSMLGGCYFNGLAVETVKDPSFGSCKFPSVTPSKM
ncbi:hypothetical protein ACHQM5_020156 [Ranunculus cassubicifolius]